MTAQEFEYKGMHCKKWLSDNEKAKIQIIHGLGEMSEYYEQFAEYITAKGVSVYLCEYREHGRTALPADIDNIVQTAAKECGDFSSYVHSESETPLFLLGHSLGAQMAQYVICHCDSSLYSGVILTGCPYIHDTKALLSDIEAEISEKGADAPGRCPQPHRYAQRLQIRIPVSLRYGTVQRGTARIQGCRKQPLRSLSSDLTGRI